MTTQHTSASFAKLVDEHLSAANLHLEALRSLPEDASAEVVARTFDAIGADVGAITGLAELLSAVHPDEAVRTAAETAIQRTSAFATALGLDRSAYEPFSRLDVSNEPDAAVKRFVEHTVRDYRRSGVDKDDATRTKIKSLQEQLVQTGQEFDRNSMTGGRTHRLGGGHADLVGLPQDFLDAHPEDADGSVTLSTDPTDFLPVLLYAEKDETRRGLFMEYHSRAFPENDEVLKRLLAERHELATTLGFDHWAHYTCEDKMVGSAQAARDFATRVSERARPVGKAEYAELLEELRTLEPSAERVMPWQSRFLMERVKRKKHSFDSQSVRPYFAYESVKNGVLRTTEALFGVEIRRAEDAEVWHPSVECYEVLEGGKLSARFYLDMFPRDAKFKHAAMFQIYGGVAGPNGETPERLPEAALVCNFPEPKDGDPALLLHDQVTTLFHEFGHLLHHLFSVQAFHGFAGITCEWDFVEVPSQLYEEWAW
ncbi:MAG: M3 family metallopeptidase, partial [Planctomycetota bacterium]